LPERKKLLMACTCGHAIEEHEDEIGPCEGVNTLQDGKGRREVQCECLGYEEADDEEEE
jgi:hypothetical protein